MIRQVVAALSMIVAMCLISSCAGATTKEGMEWLDARSKEEGVVVLPSGLMYKELKAGTSDKSPKRNTKCMVHYYGHLIDGTEFDSSYARGEPLTFSPDMVVKGWTEAMMLMKEGATWELYIPSELAYGDRGAGQVIPAGSALKFELNLITVMGGEEEL